MDKPSICHLLDDLSLGGVTANLALFDQGDMTEKYRSTRKYVQPRWQLAPVCDADVIITHFPPNWANLAFAHSLRRRNPQARIFHMEHSYSPEWAQLYVHDLGRFKTMLGLAFKAFDTVICVSPSQRAWFEKLNICKPAQCHVIAPWSDFSGLAELALPQWDKGASMTIGCFGRLTRDKGFLELIRSFLALPSGHGFSLLLGGYGPMEEEIRDLTRHHRDIKLYGRVDDRKDFLGRCDIIAVPSRFETYGLVAAEARLSGRPLLVAPVAALVDQLGPGDVPYGVVVDFADAADMGRQLEKLFMSSRPQGEAMARAARTSALSHGDDAARAWTDLLEGALLPLRSAA